MSFESTVMSASLPGSSEPASCSRNAPNAASRVYERSASARLMRWSGSNPPGGSAVLFRRGNEAEKGLRRSAALTGPARAVVDAGPVLGRLWQAEEPPAPAGKAGRAGAPGPVGVQLVACIESNHPSLP